MSYYSATVDTVVWIKYVSNYAEKPEIQAMFDACLERKIKLYTSSRVFSFDTTTQNPEQTQHIRQVAADLGVSITPAPFILGDLNDQKGTGSMLGSSDYLADHNVDERETKFISVVGCHPTQKHPAQLGGRESNHIGDYDALLQHYMNEFDVFLTYDKHLYFEPSNRRKYQEKLGLKVMSPSEFLKELLG
ncbi:MAG TPA: hypothetical protein PKJ63_15180 [Cyclobacteriaceae bacterium]|nr:hypothetical protein [Cyclobacteriaceae bacterium]